MRRLALAALALLAACSGKNGATITINGSDTGDGGNTIVQGNSSQISVSIPGLSGSIKLPKLKMDANSFDMNGVHLYPGSTVTGFNVDAHDDDKTGDDQGTVQVSFDSPAAPTAVRDWFQARLSGAGFKLQPEGNGLAGKTEQGKPFKLDLQPAGNGRAHGTIVTG